MSNGFRLGIIIFLLSIITLIAEFYIYIAFDAGSILLGKNTEILSWFFVGLMISTGAVGILAPVSALIQKATKNKESGDEILVIGVGIVIVGYVLITTFGAFLGSL
jgi:hypothetical protein